MDIANHLPAARFDHADLELPGFRLDRGTDFFCTVGFRDFLLREQFDAVPVLYQPGGPVLPGAWVCASITLLVVLITGQITPEAALSRWFTTVIFSPKPPFIDNVYWTLGVEVFFYGFVFILLCFDQFKNLERFAVCLMVLSTGFWIAYYLIDFPILSYIRGSREFTLLLFRHGCFFALGIIAWLCMDKVTPRRLVVIALCVLGGLLQIVDEHGSQPAAPGVNATAAPAIVMWLLSLIAIGLSIFYRDRIPSASWIRTMGLMTYPLYLIHNVVGAAFIRLISGIGQVPAVLITIGAAIFLSWVITTTLEQWGQNAIRRLLDESFIKSRLPSPFLYRKNKSPIAQPSV